MDRYDRIIIGAGIYGLYSAVYCSEHDLSVLVLECEPESFTRATYINQARVHQGYHYPRSLSTALRSAKYFHRFNQDYEFCINRMFDQIYAVSENFSWTDADQFESFCRSADIPCQRIDPNRYFHKGMCSGAFLTEEYTYDAMILKEHFMSRLEKDKLHITAKYNIRIERIEKQTDCYIVYYNDGKAASAPYILNASYASVNQVIGLIGAEKFKIKYELCELILCNTNDKLCNTGITVMDGPFFSIMPFGKTGLHSLTAVTFTPHSTCYDELPTFPCQKGDNDCTNERLGNCNTCISRPATSFPYMSGLAKRYLKQELKYEYDKSIFSMKPILMRSEIDDSRPTVIRIHTEEPYFVSVLSGKVNTVYDMDEVLLYE